MRALENLAKRLAGRRGVLVDSNILIDVGFDDPDWGGVVRKRIGRVR